MVRQSGKITTYEALTALSPGRPSVLQETVQVKIIKTTALKIRAVVGRCGRFPVAVLLRYRVGRILFFLPLIEFIGTAT